MFRIYSLLLGLAALFALPWFLIQGLRHGKYLASLRARLGGGDEIPRSTGDAIWLHAVSVGELLACQRLVNEIKARFPARPLFVSATTETGHRAARDRMASGALHADAVFFCPFDFRWTVRRVLRRVCPAALVVAETELWPNLFREAARRGARVVVVNARVSDRSFPRYRLFRFFLRRVLRHGSALLAQSDEDARRLREMGAEPACIRVLGNLKYDQQSPAPLPAWLDEAVAAWAAPGLLMAGSTASGEEDFVLDAYTLVRAALPAVRCLIAPRRPERFNQVARMAEARGYRVARRSQRSPDAARPLADADVLLLDTVGEMAAFYRHATVAFVGGSLVPHGGQNVLEAALFARPIVVGPHMHNFREITAALLRAGGLRQVQSGDELGGALDELFRQPARAAALGESARRLLAANRGSTARTAEAIELLLVEQQDRGAEEHPAVRVQAGERVS